MPMIIQSIGYDILSNILTLNESNILSILNYVCLIFTAIILIMGLILYKLSTEENKESTINYPSEIILIG